MSDEAAGEPVEEATPSFPVPDGPAGGQGNPPTGDGRVDEVLGRLRELDGLPVSGHVEVFEDVHQRLQELLVSADQDETGAPGPPGRGSPA
jgi:hypothetical protein